MTSRVTGLSSSFGVSEAEAAQRRADALDRINAIDAQVKELESTASRDAVKQDREGPTSDYRLGERANQIYDLKKEKADLEKKT